ncbi:major facilitator superfamily transporter [Streptomyces sp. NBRC 110611]|uniref:MFS transporter n=1 Tax=Streptomyces sp. NBRC 110611 TaxID=1621259 RepID=UPI0008301A8F|nr:MFS transporter [Streptomyces sp. NBRC 110611]GAU71257.1 major facilitator superfamily transporter [Streptomyces sp. NBRC 110611]
MTPSHHASPDRPRSRLTRLAHLTGPQYVLLAGSFLIPLGSFAVLPFMSVLLHERLGMGLGTVGVVLAIASFVQFAGGVVGAAVAGRIGLQRTMLLALVIRTVGFAGFLPGLGHPAAAVTALFLVSCGAALYLPANKAYLVHRVDRERRPLLLSASSSALNAGIALGPIAAAPFVLSASVGLFTAVTVLFTAITVGHALLPVEIPDRRPEEREDADGTGQPPPRGEDQDKAHESRYTDRTGLPVLPFAITALSVYLFMFFQHYLSVYTVSRTSTVFYGLVLSLYAMILVVAQPLLSDWIAHLPYTRALILGFAALATGMCTLAVGHPATILAGALLICLGEIVLFLTNDLEALAQSPRSPAVVFGRQRLAAGIGAFASGIAGGKGYELTEQSGHPGLFWTAVAVQCALLPPLLVRILRRRRPCPTAGPDRPAATRTH